MSQHCVEWAVAARPLPGEAVSGDVAVCVAAGERVLLAAIDGLGHGTEAAAAAALARDTIRRHRDEPLVSLLRLCHAALAETRGVALTLAQVECDTGGLRWVGVGNVEAHVVRRGEGSGPRVVASALLYGGTVGFRLPEVRPSSLELRPDDLVILATDGVDADFPSHVATGQPVDRIAASILDRCSRPTDDALVAVARHRRRDA
jgi:negative regulator of sigma-B (phosphoserine phosphatase)